MLAHGFRGLNLKLLDSIKLGPGMWHNTMPLNMFVAVTRSNIKDLIAENGCMGCIKSQGKSHSSRSLTHLGTLHALSGSRKRWLLVLSLLSFLCCPRPQCME